MMDDPVQYLKDRFNRKAGSDPRVAVELEGVEKVVMIDLGETCHTLLLDSTGLHDTAEEREPDIRVTTTKEVLSDILEKRLDPMKAYAEGMVKVEASILDLMRARTFLSS